MMLARCLCRAGTIVLITLVATACSAPPPSSSGEAVDKAYGIPPGSAPPDLLRPDGLLDNGLLPLPPNSGS
jgi:hypothetical protein